MIDVQPRANSLLETAIALRRVTEAAALAAAPYVGGGEEIKNEADGAAVAAMDEVLCAGAIACWVAIGEGVKDGAPILEHGKRYGDIGSVALALAVDPIEGTTSLALGHAGAMSIAALSASGFPEWHGIPYMNKLVVGPEVADLVENGEISLDGDPADNMQTVADALGMPVSMLRVAVLDRPRNADVIEAAQRLGVRLSLLKRGDVLPVLKICAGGNRMHMLYGSGGAPEAVIAAALVAIEGGAMQVAWHPQSEKEVAIAKALGQYGVVMNVDDLVGRGELHFAATAITSNELMLGHRHINGEWVCGQSIVASRVGAGE